MIARLFPLAAMPSRRSVAPLVAGLSAHFAGEASARVARILSVVVIARQIDPAMLGVAALALSLFELVRVLANVGIGQQLVRAGADELPALCRTAHRLFGRWCWGVAAVQCAVAGGLAAVDATEAARMLLVLALVYPLMARALVHTFLLHREQRQPAIARIAATQTIADHLLTLLLVLAWASPWALILPKLLTVPLWVTLTRRARPWRPDRRADVVPAARFLGFGAAVLAGEFAAAARLHLDKLLVGALLGVEALGLYYFAFHAGLGISQALVTAFGNTLFPFLCAAEGRAERTARLRMAALLGGGVFLPLVAAQGFLAPWYVPLVFGAGWASAVPYVATLCLAALPLLAGALVTAAQRAAMRPGRDAWITAAAATCALGGLAAGALHSLDRAILAYVAGLALVLFPAALAQLAAPRRDPRIPRANQGAYQ